MNDKPKQPSNAEIQTQHDHDNSDYANAWTPSGSLADYHRGVLLKRLEATKTIVKRLWQWIHDLQAGMYINCVYCGHRYGPDDEVEATMQQALYDHIKTCPEHPLSIAQARLDAVESVLAEKYFAAEEDYQVEVVLVDDVKAAIKGDQE